MPHLSLCKKQCFSDLVVPYVPQKCRDNSGFREWKEKCGCSKNPSDIEILQTRTMADFSGQIIATSPQKVAVWKGNPRNFQRNLGWWNIIHSLARFFSDRKNFRKGHGPWLSPTHLPATTVKAISSWKTYGFSPERVVTVSMFLGAMIFFQVKDIKGPLPFLHTGFFLGIHIHF